jgi:phosphoglycolate phosphatase
MSRLPAGLRAVIFDFDFTLGDSSSAVVICMDRALKEMGLGPVVPEEVCRTIGLTLEIACERLTGVTDPEVHATFKSLFVRAADDVMVAQTELLEGVLPALDLLRDGGIPLGIVTTKYRFRVEDILDHFGERHRFRVIVGGDDVVAHKPDPQGLIMALERLDVSPVEALYVGDHTVDASAAQSAGVPFVGVLTGTTLMEAFREYSTVGVLPGVRELPSLLAGFDSWPPPPQPE